MVAPTSHISVMISDNILDIKIASSLLHQIQHRFLPLSILTTRWS